MGEPIRLVIDTNVLVSRLLFPGSIPGRAVRTAADRGRILVSPETMSELAEVLSRAKFDPYLTIQERQGFIRQLGRIVEFVAIDRRIALCRDPDDDRILEVAVNGAADLVVTGDGDLLALRNVEGIAIVDPAAYLRMVEAG